MGDPPVDVFSLVGDVLKGLRGTAQQSRMDAWRGQLVASGNAPDPADEADLFARHTLVVLASRMIAGLDVDGFGWVDDDTMNHLQEVVDARDWNEPGDVLRPLYMNAVPPRYRMLFGEYYTPDWLAEKVCGLTIDDTYIREQLDNFHADKPVQGVLDPACGSGTFLCQAARRINDSEPLGKSSLDGDDRRRFVLSMISGMDIHPVAVEMARANLSRMFPGISSGMINIFQGDSLLASRPDAGLHALAADSLVLFTPGGSQFMLPNGFLDDEPGIREFVESARTGQPLRDDLGGYLTDRTTLAEGHVTLTKIMSNEGDHPWEWTILNQAAAIRMRRRPAGRIVSNPPWIRFNRITQARKAEMLVLARELGLWVGGNVSTSFDIAQLFVARCPRLFLVEGGRSSWVLPHGALYGGSWRALRDRTAKKVTGRWNLNRLPFPNTPTCVLFMGPPAGEYMLAQTGRRPAESWSWSDVERVTELRAVTEFPQAESDWGGRNSPVWAGATLFPHCFTRVVAGGGRVKTARAQHQPWRDLGTFAGAVPRGWLHECVTFANLMPFLVPDYTLHVLPVVDGSWDPARMDNDLYRVMSDAYAIHCGRGEATPQTLDYRLNHMNGLMAQSGRVGPRVLYNPSGDNMYACRLDGFRFVAHGVFYVGCSSTDEACYLAAILNAPSMLGAFRAARQSDRDFGSHIWRKVPIQRYDGSDQHEQLVILAKRAERTAAATHDPTLTPNVNRNNIRASLAGVLAEIDVVVGGLLPDHAS